MQQFSLVIHGGAGTILKEDMSPALEQAYQNGLQEAMDAGIPSCKMEVLRWMQFRHLFYARK